MKRGRVEGKLDVDILHIFMHLRRVHKFINRRLLDTSNQHHPSTVPTLLTSHPSAAPLQLSATTAMTYKSLSARAPTVEAHPDSFLRFSSLPKELQRAVVQQCGTEDLLSLSKYNSMLSCVPADHA
jgi:hypothetical protein